MKSPIKYISNFCKIHYKFANEQKHLCIFLQDIKNISKRYRFYSFISILRKTALPGTKFKISTQKISKKPSFFLRKWQPHCFPNTPLWSISHISPYSIFRFIPHLSPILVPPSNLLYSRSVSAFLNPLDVSAISLSSKQHLIILSTLSSSCSTYTYILMLQIYTYV